MLAEGDTKHMGNSNLEVPDKAELLQVFEKLVHMAKSAQAILGLLAEMVLERLGLKDSQVGQLRRTSKVVRHCCR